MNTHTLINNTAQLQYEYHIGDAVALAEYVRTPKGEIFLTHTEVPPSLQGQGIASALIGDVLADIDRQGLRVVPVCPFVSDYIRRHPEWQRIVTEQD